MENPDGPSQSPNPQKSSMEKKLLEKLSEMTIGESEAAKKEDFQPQGNKTIKRTGLVYDERMTKHCNVWDKSHPERPDRIKKIFKTLSDDGLVERCLCLPARLVTREELLAVHSVEHVDEMEKLQEKSSRDLFKRGEEFDSIYLSHHAYESAALAAGCTLELLEAVLTDKVQNGAAIVRPPGHHALSDRPMGFCIFNNVAVAAKIAKEKYGLSRILIVDWDIHWGNGVEKLFEEDPDVLYFSIHRYDNGKYWPHCKEADFDQVGVGQGQGKTIHVAWNKIGMGDSEYLMAFTMLLLPVAYEFRPELVLVCCGFDSGLGDPKGLCKVTPEGFAQLTHLLMGLADGKVMLVLEGGYNLSTISSSMSSCIKCLLGDTIPAPEFSQVKESALDSILNAVRVQSKYWMSLKWAEMCLLNKDSDPKQSLTRKREDEENEVKAEEQKDI